MRRALLLLTAVSLVAGITYGLARGGDHDHGDRGGGSDHETFNERTHQTWCDINPDCNGWNNMMAQYRAYEARRPAVAFAPAPQRTYAQVLPVQRRPVVAVRAPVVKRPRAVAQAPLDIVPSHLRVAYDALAGE